MAQVDWLVLTAANRAQARGYTAQLRAREARGAFPSGTRWMVVPDPGGRRAGSGGSTVWVLLQLARSLLRRSNRPRSIAQLFENRRVLLIHSGGDSRRLCAYAALGKVFLPLPCRTPDGAPAALFDLIAAGLLSLPAPRCGQVLIASGDVVLSFDPGAVDFSRPGVVGVSYPGSIERGRRHGVYVADRAGRVLEFLQKPDEQTARSTGAVDAAGRVLIDTGIISLDPEAAARWLGAAGARLTGGRLQPGDGFLNDLRQRRSAPVDLYEQWLPALVRAHEGRPYRALYDQPFHVNILPFCDFFHIGSTRELLSNIGTLNRTARKHGFANFDQSFVAERAALEGAFVYNSVLTSPDINAGQNVLLESVHTDQPVDLPRANVVAGWPKEAKRALRLPPGWGTACLPVSGSNRRSSWSVVLFGVDDDFKTSAEAGATFGNRPLTVFLEHHKLTHSVLWPRIPPDQRSLWNARLWTVGPLEKVFDRTLWMCGGGAQTDVERWRRSLRVSMADLLNRVDHGRLLAIREENRRIAELHNLQELLRSGSTVPASRVLAAIRDAGEAEIAQARVDGLIRGADHNLRNAHLYKLAHMIRDRFGKGLPSHPQLGADELEHEAFACVARAVGQKLDFPAEPRPAAILRDQVVWATCPVRIDFAGGWSDTPPICTEMGGTVLNAAVTLNGQYPVQVIAKLQERPGITLTSLDLAERVEIRSTPDPEEYRNPREWAALPKAALILAGICPGDTREPLTRWLDRLGGGLDITLFSALPKGSGLGTSSILGAAMLACLARVLGEPVTRDALISRTSLLEQMMTTGGGWQDQIGGIEPGVKLIRTNPGLEQGPSVHRIALDFSPEGPFRPRLLLYYTGYTRMARNILKKVVGRYLAYDPDAIEIIRLLKESAEEMESALGMEDVDAFGRGIERYWELKKRLDPGSTNEKIEALLKPLNRHLTGRLLTGAGGGGFLFMVARDAEAAARIRRHLEKNPPNPLARFFTFAIDPKGLSVTVL